MPVSVFLLDYRDITLSQCGQVPISESSRDISVTKNICSSMFTHAASM